MSIIGKEVLPFYSTAYNSGNGEFVEVSDQDLKDSGVSFAFIQQTFHLFALLNLKISRTNMQHYKNSVLKYIPFQQIHISYTRRGTIIQMQSAHSNTS